MENTRERLIRYLQDAHAAERGILEMLRDFADESGDSEGVKALFQEHIVVTQSQIERLEDRIRILGSEPSGTKGFFNALMAKVGDLANIGHDDYDKTTQNLIKAYATEHLEQGMYSSLIAYAEACGDEETALLAEEIMAEEEEAALKIFPMIEVCAQRTYDATLRSPA